MAFRGRGRGRGAFNRRAKEEPYVLFPEIELPPHPKVTDEQMRLVVWNSRLQNFWKNSPYYLKDPDSTATQINVDIERYSDREKRKAKPAQESFLDYMELNEAYFPRELLEGIKTDRKKRTKTVNWNSNSDVLAKLDLFEKMEKNQEGQEEENKEGEEGEEEEAAEDDGEYSDDGDYNQNIDFDDDEDDFNMPDDDDDEGAY